MWRNQMEQIGGRFIFGTPFVGLLAEQILADTATGPNGPGAMYNDGLVPGKRYRMVLANPASFPGTVFEDGSFIASASFSDTYRLYEDNVLQAYSGGGFDVPFSFSIGAGARVADANITIKRGAWDLSLHRVSKQPREVKDVIIEMAPWFLGRADDPLSVDFTVSDPAISATVVLTGTRILAVLTGGVDGGSYNISIRMTTNATPPIVREFDLAVEVTEVA
jgi:hypothetical protein